MNIVSKFTIASILAVTAFATSAKADWDGHPHYYDTGHRWHGHWYGPGYYGPRAFVGAPWYWGGFHVSVGVPVPPLPPLPIPVPVVVGGPVVYPAGGYWSNHRYYYRGHYWYHRRWW